MGSRVEMATIEGVVGDHIELTQKHMNTLLDIVINQRTALYDVIKVVSNMPGVDKEAIALVFKTLDDFDPKTAFGD